MLKKNAISQSRSYPYIIFSFGAQNNVLVNRHMENGDVMCQINGKETAEMAHWMVHLLINRA